MRSAGWWMLPALLAVPLLPPLHESASTPALSAGVEAVRVSELISRTALLSLSTTLLTLPAGLCLAILLFRSRCRLAPFVRGTMLLGVFVPLPVFACAWQPSLGHNWPWGRGIFFAAIVHSLAALPVVVWIVGLGLRGVSREREEVALMNLPRSGVLWRVTLPAIRIHVLAAFAWVVLQTTGEITVTDMALVRTFAEETYTQFVSGDGSGLSRAVAISLPMSGLLLALFAGCLALLRMPPEREVARSPLMMIRKHRIEIDLLLAAFWLAWAGLPLWNLLCQAAGRRPDTPGNVDTLIRELQRSLHLNFSTLAESLVEAMLVGVMTMAVAIMLGEVVRRRRWLGRATMLVLGALAVTPGPVLGFGLLRVILHGMDAEDLALGRITNVRPFRVLFYDGPTPAPVMAAQFFRFLPLAAIVVWPALWRIPRSLDEATRLEGATGKGRLRSVVWPAVRTPALAGVVMVTAFALGEVSAGKIVQVPGRQTFVQELLNQMHYGVTSTVASLAIWQLVAVAGLVGLGGLCFFSGRKKR